MGVTGYVFACNFTMFTGRNVIFVSDTWPLKVGTANTKKNAEFFVLSTFGKCHGQVRTA